MMKGSVLTPSVPMDILLIEDNDEQALMVKEALDDCKLQNQIIVMKRPMEAVQYLRQCVTNDDLNGSERTTEPGLIFLDVDMKEKRGFDVLHDLRSDPKLMTIPIVILTDSLDKADLRCSMSHGVTGYFLKPMEAAQLKKVVKDVEEHWTILAQAPCAN